MVIKAKTEFRSSSKQSQNLKAKRRRVQTAEGWRRTTEKIHHKRQKEKKI